MSTAIDLYAALGPLVGNRVYPEEAAQDAARPFIVYRLTDQNPVTTMDGLTHACIEQYSIDVWHDTRSQVDALSKLVHEAMRTSDMDCTRGGSAWGADIEMGFEGCSHDYTIIDHNP